jgi:YesN/AraC family two-component response regulator
MASMYKLIIVDDEIHIREGLKENLSWHELGFVITGLFENGRQALNYVERYEIDVALTDVRMPVMDGLEFARRVYEGRYPAKIVFLSGYAEFEYAQKAIEYGVHAYILKPVDWDKLALEFLKIREILDAKHHAFESGGEPRGYYEKIKNKVQEYIQENYRTATLESAAVRVFISPNYLSKIFKRKAGISFSEYLLEVKMKKAEEMLLRIENKIYEVAFAVGYDNPKNFSRAFKQYSGKTPREFRETGQ